ncbi:hypothetical protein APR41_18135 [Salegentibacter salinarum]|uniref:YD repeat-containing protein n=1 Tax=Salegentibacter salinarum TaxID=447422 RepID=A0A2N0TTH1_9FLAO|nr:hypothetical protein [Salegentibacter salinarum]PKD18033.1 hypothetical protein APR41_18135 [Salegentibacter salinarum]SKB99397.1 hypothetical protein SAMN05660903_03699 [Salegentibacter salinarum]
MKKIFIIIFYIYSFNCVIAQEDLNEFIKYQPTQPETTEIQKIGDFSPPNAFGAQPINLQITNVDIGNLSIPITLSYTSSSGIKVDEKESVIGLGWDLSILNNYIEIVEQGASLDFNQSHSAYASYQEINNRYQVQNLDSMFVLNDQLKSNALNTPFVNKDYISDQINYNFLGKTGTILKDSLGNFIDFTSSKNELEIVQHSINNYEVIDGDGNHYIFDKVVSYNLDSSSKNIKKRFYLSEIELYDGQVVEFLYSDGQDEGVTVSDSYSSSSIMVTRMFEEALQNPSQNMTISDFTPIFEQNNNSITYATPNILKEMVFPNGKVSFDYLSETNQLNKIEVWDNISIIEKFVFKNSDFFLDSSGAPVAARLEAIDRIGGDETQEKLYRFSYNETPIPQRATTKGDYWGFHNGRETDVPDFSYYYNSQEYDYFGSNRRPVFNYTKAGILEEIIYATGGKSKFYYEPNYYKTEKVITDPSEGGNKKINLAAIGQNPAVSYQTPIDSTSFYIEHGSISSTGGITVTYAASRFTQNSSQLPYYKITDPQNTVYTKIFNREDEKLSGTFNITNLPTGWYKVIAYVGDASLFPNDSEPSIFNTASVELTLSWKEYSGDEEMDYEDVLVTGGGLRIKSIENYDSLEDNVAAETKSFEYGNSSLNGYGVGEFLGVSNQVYPISDINADLDGENHILSNFLINKNITDLRFWGGVSGGGVFYAQYTGKGIQLSSDPLFPISYKGNSVFYPKVTIYNSGEKGDLGYIENIYSPPSRIEVRDVMGDISTSSSAHLELNKYSDYSGVHLIKEVKFNSLNDTVFLKNYNYTKKIISEFPRLAIKPSEYTLHYSGSPIIVPPSDIRAMSKKNIKHFYYKEKLYQEKLVSTSIRNFYENGNIETIQDLEYVANKSFRISEKTTYGSDGKINLQRLIYPDQIISSNSLGFDPIAESELNNYNSLASTGVNRINRPVQIENYKKLADGTIFSSEVQRTYYNTFNTKLFASSIWTGRLGVPLYKEIEFLDYDYNGNYTIIRKVNGPPVIYLWGYNGEYLIAKVQNSNLEELKVALGVQDLTEIDEQDIPSIDALRAELPNSMISTYTYKPLIGLLTIRNPNGKIITYNYDSFNRLHFKMDDDQNLLEEFNYHYKSFSE